jgi:hypothetical protein
MLHTANAFSPGNDRSISHCWKPFLLTANTDGTHFGSQIRSCLLLELPTTNSLYMVIFNFITHPWIFLYIYNYSVNGQILWVRKWRSSLNWLDTSIKSTQYQSLGFRNCLTAEVQHPSGDSPRHPSLSANVIYVVYKYNLISQKYAKFNNRVLVTFRYCGVFDHTFWFTEEFYNLYSYSCSNLNLVRLIHWYNDPGTKLLRMNIYELIKISNKTSTSSARDKGQLLLLIYPLPHVKLQ